MSLSSYDIEGVFKSSVVIPSAEEKSLEEQNQMFKPGLHGCPCCQAHELSRFGEAYKEVAGWLFDASLRAKLCSEKNEKVTEALYRTGLLSNGRLRKDLEVIFHRTSKPFGSYQTRRRANYRHLKGSGAQCSADDEHDAVISLIRLRLADDMQKIIPGCRVEWLEDKRIDPSKCRPDLQAKVYVDKDLIDHLAIEVQKSAIELEIFKARHIVLAELATKAVWFFRSSGLSGRFRPCIDWALSNGVHIGSYDINHAGELIISQILDLSDPLDKPSVSDLQDSRCNRSEYLEEQARRKSARPSVSLQSEVLGDLSFMYSSFPKTIESIQGWDPPLSDDFELGHLALPSSPYWVGIPPWEHH
jgi:hypothetical protein